MPGVLPSRRIRRLGPRPSLLRANAVNSIDAISIAPFGDPRWAGPRRKALNCNRIAMAPATRAPLGEPDEHWLRHVLAAIHFDDLPGHVAGKRVGCKKQKRAGAFFGGAEPSHRNRRFER